ncbi:MAG: Nif3-like dinuclear metal center hexameric protein [Clostridia bacterium]|nr:Nif3-like dinuclear metal center hexameric protein [Clostridia bacterium]
MKAFELLDELKVGGTVRHETCDTFKAGNPETELKRVAVCMTATVDVIKKAKEWGADALIVHEPTYYDHMDVKGSDRVTALKEKLICESGIAIFRYHDYMHARDVDQITEGELHFLGLTGEVEPTPHFGSYILRGTETFSAVELAERMEKMLGIRHIRIAGSRDKKTNKIALCFGSPAGVYEILTDESVGIVITGEACEWKLAEYARDADLLGFTKSLIVMGHIPSERDGMKLLAQRLQEKHEDIAFAYIESEEVYTYTDET